MSRVYYCMTLVYILGFVTSISRARAFSPSCHNTRIGAVAAAAAAAGAGARTTTTSTTKLYAKTGWNHNQPSSGDKQSSPSSAPTTASTTTTKTTTEPRTGWLHKTKPNVETQNNNNNNSSSNKEPISQAQLLLARAKMLKERNHRIIAPPAFHAGFNDQVLVVTEHKISVPVYRLSSSSSSSSSSAEKPQKDRRIDLFFTLVEILDDTDQSWWKSLQDTTTMDPQQRAVAYIQKASLTNADDMILYLQGGPGFGAPTPIVGLGFGSSQSSWATKALSKYKRLCLMDQRGTGRSTPITKQRLEQEFPGLFCLDDKEQEHNNNNNNDDDNLPSLEDFAESHQAEYQQMKDTLQEATEYLAQFRADNIVQDAEEIKDALLLPVSNDGTDATNLPRPYGCALGQSFGGFCMMTYLSQVAHPPRICLFTGGIAPMFTPIYDLYDKLWDRVKDRSLRYYDEYPGDIPVVKQIVQALLRQPPILPSGSKLTARRFLQIGLGLGGSPSSFASLHKLFNTAFLNADDNDNNDLIFTRAFLKAMDSEQSFDDNPLYFLLHESIYADGKHNNNSPTNWAAHRAFESRVLKTPSDFDYRRTSAMSTTTAQPVLFFGEMVFPWMANGDYAELSGIGMRSLAHAIAQKSDWNPLYDADAMRHALSQNQRISRAAAAVYYDDMYVDFEACQKVTQKNGSDVGPLEQCKLYITNEYQHSGLRDDGAAIFEKLHGMATGSVRTPS